MLWNGIGRWGLNKTVQWAWDITNFVWWVGIGHAGTLISAVLLLFRQKWRMAINRSAEAMTIFAVFMAGLFPLIHMGRLWLGYWVLPLPNHFGSLWVNFNSPLLWDVFAISTYLSVSLVFWYIGLIPDFATIRDRAKKPISKKMYSILSFGWCSLPPRARRSGTGSVTSRSAAPRVRPRPSIAASTRAALARKAAPVSTGACRPGPRRCRCAPRSIGVQARGRCDRAAEDVGMSRI